MNLRAVRQPGNSRRESALLPASVPGFARTTNQEKTPGTILGCFRPIHTNCLKNENDVNCGNTNEMNM